MGWASGSSLAAEVWAIVEPFIDIECKQQVACEIIEAFEREDCDTLMEAEDLWHAAGKDGDA